MYRVKSRNFNKTNIHGDTIKCKPNCLCHIHVHLIPDHIILKLSRYLANSTKHMNPKHRNISFGR